jgi:hypothetical protein
MKGCRPARGGNPSRGAQQGRGSSRKRPQAAYKELATQHHETQPVRPEKALEGRAAAMKEYHHYKAACMLHVWREKWKAFLLNHH